MTDYYKHLRENLGTGYFSNLGLPGSLHKEITDLYKHDNKMSRNFANSVELTEQDWTEIEKVIRIWESPLNQALR